MKIIENIDLAGYCLHRINLLNRRIRDNQEWLQAKIERNESYKEMRQLKAEIDGMNEELEKVTALYQYYDEKLF